MEPFSRSWTPASQTVSSTRWTSLTFGPGPNPSSLCQTWYRKIPSTTSQTNSYISQLVSPTPVQRLIIPWWLRILLIPLGIRTIRQLRSSIRYSLERRFSFSSNPPTRTSLSSKNGPTPRVTWCKHNNFSQNSGNSNFNKTVSFISIFSISNKVHQMLWWSETLLNKRENSYS